MEIKSEDDWNPWKKHALFSFVIFGMGFFVVGNLDVDYKCKLYLVGNPVHLWLYGPNTHTQLLCVKFLLAGPTL